MAFCDLKPVRVSDDKTGATYVIGEVIAVYNIGSPLPTVYSWDMVKSVSITRREMIFSFLGSKTNISFSNKMFRSSEEALRAIAIIECQSKANNFTYLHEKRLFPLKSLYRECSPGKESYVGEGMLDEADTAAALS